MSSAASADPGAEGKPKMSLPTVAIVGRPNVGKSSLFNRLARRRISIVDPTSGVTRDRVSTEVRHKGCLFELVDTGGIGLVDEEELRRQVQFQIEQAVSLAELLLLVVDVREGCTPLDEYAAKLLRPSAKQLLLVANKADSPKLELGAGEFHRLGLGEPMPVSARTGAGRNRLLEEIVGRLGGRAVEPREKPGLRLAIVGKRNVGKSTLINHLAGFERVIVSEIPGTTRDAIDVHVRRGEREYVLIDTPGFRKKGKVSSSVEFYSVARAQRSVRRCDVAILMIDALARVSRVDKSLGSYIVSQLKPCIIAVNKCDLLDEIASDKYSEYLSQELPGLGFAPIAFISAKTGTNVGSLFGLAAALHQQVCTRVSTARLNRALQEAVGFRPPSPRRGRLPKIYFGTQVGIDPITIVVFANDPRLFRADYERYLVGFLREHLDVPEVPVKLELRPRRTGSGDTSGTT